MKIYSLQGVNAGYNAALSKEENKISKLTFDKEINQWVDIYSYELGLINYSWWSS